MNPKHGKSLAGCSRFDAFGIHMPQGVLFNQACGTCARLSDRRHAVGILSGDWDAAFTTQARDYSDRTAL